LVWRWRSVIVSCPAKSRMPRSSSAVADGADDALDGGVVVLVEGVALVLLDHADLPGASSSFW
jgi:hypothetical protein